MKTSILLAFLFTCNVSALCQNTELSALQVVQEQLDAYNARNIDAFAAVFHENVEFVEFSNGTTTIKGKAEMVERFTKFFEDNPELQSNLSSRMVIGNKVIDHEKITGLSNRTGVYELVVIYEVKEGLINKVTTIRK